MSAIEGENFEEARRHYVEVEQQILYRQLDGFYKEGLIDEAHKLEQEINRKNEIFGVKPPANAYMPNLGVVEIDLNTLKVKRVL